MKQTPFFERHLQAGARMVEFAGWRMPIQYPTGIIAEHLAVRRNAGLFDVSHMGRFRVTGTAAGDFLRQALTNDAAALRVGFAHYTMLANEAGGAIDDAFLYHPTEGKYLLVVNASNKEKDWAHLQELLKAHPGAVLEDVSDSVAMMALQGPASAKIVEALGTESRLPQSQRNTLANLKLAGVEVCAARTGYTGEPVCFELFVAAENAGIVWDKLVEKGAAPIGLGARDTLRLEAGLPLYGHELGIGKDGLEIPIYAIGQAHFAVNFDDPNRPFAGRKALVKQSRVREAFKQSHYDDIAILPKVVRQFRLQESGIAREGSIVYRNGRPAGWVSSGTMVPYWEHTICNDSVKLKETHAQRAIGLCLVEPAAEIGSEIAVEVRGRQLRAQVVARNLQNTKGAQTWAVI